MITINDNATKPESMTMMNNDEHKENGENYENDENKEIKKWRNGENDALITNIKLWR